MYGASSVCAADESEVRSLLLTSTSQWRNCQCWHRDQCRSRGHDQLHCYADDCATDSGPHCRFIRRDGVILDHRPKGQNSILCLPKASNRTLATVISKFMVSISHTPSRPSAQVLHDLELSITCWQDNCSGRTNQGAAKVHSLDCSSDGTSQLVVVSFSTAFQYPNTIPNGCEATFDLYSRSRYYSGAPSTTTLQRASSANNSILVRISRGS